MKKPAAPLIMLAIFETVAITLRLALDNIFYLFNFTYIGICIALGLFLYSVHFKYARLVVQLGVGLYMLLYLGFIDGENMQIEGFWFYLFSGVFEAATIHYAGEKCVSCGKCRKVCPMNVDMTDNSRKRANGTECILCLKCVDSCPQKALKL